MSISSNASRTYTIQEASRLTGLPASTLRYYEGIGIIEPIERDADSKHRVYSEDNLNLLDAIACLNATGLSLNDMREYIRNRNKGVAAAGEQVMLLEQQEERLASEARLLEVRLNYVKLKIAYWKAIEAHNDSDAKDIGNQARLLAQSLKKL